jgi:WD40 repeat-containing protein SMU1
MEGEFTVEASDMVRIILGFLTAQGLHESAKVLRKESGIGFTNGVIQKRTVAQSIRDGDWGVVLKATTLLQEDDDDDNHDEVHEDDAYAEKKKIGKDKVSDYESRILTRIAEQVILELAEDDKNMNLAYSLLKTHHASLDHIVEEEATRSSSGGADKITKARNLEQKLAAIAGNPAKYSDITKRQEFLYGGTTTTTTTTTKSSKQDRRENLAQVVEKKREIPLNRLPTLIQQAMKWQAHTGQIPWIKEVYEDEEGSEKRHRRKRKRYDLVMGEVAGGGDKTATVVGDIARRSDTDDEESKEAIPQDILAKVKFGKSAVCESALFFPRGLITGSSDSLIEIWDASSSYESLNTADYPYQKEHAMGHNDAPILCMDLSNDGEILVSGDSDGKVKIWKLASGKCLRQYKAHDGSVTALSLSRDASRILTGSASGICREFGIVTQNVLSVYEGHTSYIHACRYVLGWNIPDDKNPQTTTAAGWVVTTSADGTMRVWKKGLQIRILQPPRDLNTTTTLLKNKKSFSIRVDPTQVLTECPAIHTLLPIPGEESRMIIVPRSSTAFLINLEGDVLQIFQTETPEVEFLSATVTASVVYFATSKGNCLCFSIRNGKLLGTIRDFTVDSTSKTNSDHRVAEVSSMIHHPFKPSLLAAFSNDKTQKKGVLTVWR